MQSLLCLCHHLDMQLPSAFAALELFLEQFPTQNIAGITPTSKAGISVPTQATAAASVVAATQRSGEIQDTEAIANKVHAAASKILGPDYAETVTLRVLMKTAEEMLEEQPNSSAQRPSTAHCLMELHSKVVAALPAAMADVTDDVCFRLLELLCMAQEGTHAQELLRRGGSLVAAGIIASAFCISTPIQAAGQHGRTVMDTLASLTAYPAEVIKGQARFCLQETLACS